MKVLVDTSVWSLALRRPKQKKQNEFIVTELKELIQEGRAMIFGSIRQELLSGISNPDQFRLLKNKLHSFPDLPVSTSDFERAAEFFNDCRAKGIQGSHFDFLICAISKRYKLSIFTRDNDFYKFANILDITLHAPRNGSV